LGGSLMLPEAKAALEMASKQYVNIDELMDDVGRRLAELTGAEWGMISTGACACIVGATAACMAGADPEKMLLLPDTTSMKNEVIIPSNHRNVYDRAIWMVGAKIVEVNTSEEMEAAINDRTAMIALYGRMFGGRGIPLEKMKEAVREYWTDISLVEKTPNAGGISLEDMVRIGKKHGIPLLVDAAAERPDFPNVYLDAGVDMVIYSGGKLMRGPQASGMLLGPKDLCKAAFLNLAPHHAYGRPMKGGKEEIMSLLAAVDMWVNGRDHEAEWKEWGRKLKYINDAVASIPGVKTKAALTERLDDTTLLLHIDWDRNNVKISPGEVHEQLRNGDPSIIIHGSRSGVEVHGYIMDTGTEVPIAKRLKEILSGAV
ncbi:MAG: aminotransferase class V-fold PLP-dependent enzyme, partial [Candidatus Latescibacteria bacterium]|nr:aminotransferase class V-fold PLP-dependent enzyme [Candidatus Latescibacterota bacterium]